MTGEARRAWELAKTARRLLELGGWRVSRGVGVSASGSAYVRAVKRGRRLLVRVSDHDPPGTLDREGRELVCVSWLQRHPLRVLALYMRWEVKRDA